MINKNELSHILTCRVYYEDTDMGGIVYYANYLKFMERGRTEWLRTYNIDQRKLKEEEGLYFVVANLSVSYLKPAKFDDLLGIHTRIIQKRRASMQLEQCIFRNKELLIQSDVTLACMSGETEKAVRLPRMLQENLVLH